jgi:hypothetical protein
MKLNLELNLDFAQFFDRCSNVGAINYSHFNMLTGTRQLAAVKFVFIRFEIHNFIILYCPGETFQGCLSFVVTLNIFIDKITGVLIDQNSICISGPL